MLDLCIPHYVWICGLMLLYLKEIRYWVQLDNEENRFEREFKHECEQDAKDKVVPESVKHLYS